MANNLLAINQTISNSKSSKTHDVLVIGAGVFGSAVASAMAKEGWKVLLIEREFSEPDRIVGELLQPGGCQALNELGLTHCLDDIDAIRVDGYAVFHNSQPVHIPYTRHPETKQKYHGRSFHHGRFVRNLREAALATKGVTGLEATVSNLIYSPDEDRVLGVSCQPKEGGPVQYHFGALTIVADGCFSKFRKACISSDPATLSHFVGFILTDCPLPFKYHGHVILANDGPVLLYQVGTHDTRVLIDISGKLPSASNGDLKKYLLEEVMPWLPECIQDSFSSAVSEQKARVMPNSMLGPSLQKFSGGGVLVGGDALNMRHPLTGGGMTVALWDVVLIAKLLSQSSLTSLTEYALVSKKIEQFHTKRKGSSTVINILACALYKLFQAKDDLYAQKLQVGCFEYFKLGGKCVDGPVELLSGVEGNILVLMYHFYRVCLYTQFLELRNSPVSELPWTMVRATKIFFTGCQIFLPLAYSEFHHIIPTNFIHIDSFPTKSPLYLSTVVLLVLGTLILLS